MFNPELAQLYTELVSLSTLRDRILDSLTLRVNRAEGNDLNLSQIFEELLGLGTSKPDDLVIEEEMIPKIICGVT
jgi:hypothetical protein